MQLDFPDARTDALFDQWIGNTAPRVQPIGHQEMKGKDVTDAATTVLVNACRASSNSFLFVCIRGYCTTLYQALMLL
jgi:hypothetical protein